MDGDAKGPAASAARPYRIESLRVRDGEATGRDPVASFGKRHNRQTVHLVLFPSADMIQTNQMQKAVHGEKGELGARRVPELGGLALGRRPGDHDVSKVGPVISGREAEHVGWVVFAQEPAIQPAKLAVTADANGESPVRLLEEERNLGHGRRREKYSADFSRRHRGFHSLDDLDAPTHGCLPLKAANSAIIFKSPLGC